MHETEELPPLVLLGDPRLMRPQPAVDPADIEAPELQARLDQLARCMTHYGGIGIAGPQVGWFARVFCLGIEGASDRYPDAGSIPFAIWINPEILEFDDRTNWAWEGCLSVPGMRGWVERPASVRVRGLDRTGQLREQHYTGFAARVFQHEYDHLEGVLYPQRVEDPSLLLPDRVMAEQSGWQEAWPSPGARDAGPGELSEQR